MPLDEVSDALVARQIAQVGGHLRRLRVERFWTMRELAARTGLSSGTVSALERGAAQPTLGTLLALQRAFDLPSIEDLLGPVGRTPSRILVDLDRPPMAAPASPGNTADN